MLASDWSLFLVLASDWSLVKMLASNWSLVIMSSSDSSHQSCQHISHPEPEINKFLALTAGKNGALLGHFEYKKEEGENAVRKGRHMGKKIAEKIREVRGEKALVGIMADSTNENTGSKAGAIRCAEEELDKNLIWVICSIHTLECQLR